jgi:shikimate dehydrogenase
MITGKTQILGVIGDPIQHSLSPVMHNAALQAMGLDYVYVPFHIRVEDLEQGLQGLRAIAVQGFNITIPHKQAIIPLLAGLTPLAEAVGAVNTVWRDSMGNWQGTNTDVEGFITPLMAFQRDWTTQNAVILGVGGAARAVVAGCAQLGLRSLHVLGRNPDKLQAFQQSWINSPISAQFEIHPWEDLAEVLTDANLIINTTPLGMHPQVDSSPLSDTDAARIKSGAIAYDLIYTPSPTRFLKQAKQEGAEILNGLDMLLYQGAAALKQWVKEEAPIEVMRNALRRHIGMN